MGLYRLYGHHVGRYRICDEKIFKRRLVSIESLFKMKTNIAALRQEYLLASLNENDLHDNPIVQFKGWFQEALNAFVDEPNAMTLSTVDELHYPKSRIVLLKGIEENHFVFYTNYHSSKGKQLTHNPNASLTFLWKELQRQIRIEGQVIKTSEEDSVNYFNTRPIESQLSAWASHQSELLQNRETLEARFEALKLQYQHMPIPKPPHWGGYALIPSYIEFWQGRASRLHDRICYKKTADTTWIIQRLNP